MVMAIETDMMKVRLFLGRFLDTRYYINLCLVKSVANENRDRMGG